MHAIALVTAGAAFLGAVLAQVLSHLFALRRENRQHLREAYQKLYAPVISDVFLFLEARTHYRPAHDILPGSVEKLLARILSHVGASLTFGSPRLVALYHGVNRYDVIDDDMTGYGKDIAVVTFLFAFVDEYAQVMRKLKAASKAELQAIDRKRDLYHIWKISTELHLSERSEVLLRHSWLLDLARIDRRFRRQLFRWERVQPGPGESCPDVARRFDQFVIGRLARDRDALRLLREGFRDAGYTLSERTLP